MNKIKEKKTLFRQFPVDSSTVFISDESQTGIPVIFTKGSRVAPAPGDNIGDSNSQGAVTPCDPVYYASHKNVGSTGIQVCHTSNKNVGSTGFDHFRYLSITLILLICTLLIPTYAFADDRESPSDISVQQEEVVMRIMLGKIKGNLRVSSPGGIKITKPGSDGEILLTSSDTYTFTRDSGKIILDNDGKKELGEEILISPAFNDSPLKINDRRYRGQLRVLIVKDFLCLINLVPLEKYLYGVVPKEFKTTYPELAKAQAIVARTYALGHRGKYEKQGFDFTNDSSSQVYGGFDAEDKICSAAVDATRGMVLLYEGKLARYPLYHSTCGGCTADNESVFLTDPIPYLRSQVCDDKLPEENERTEDKPAENNSENTGSSQKANSNDKVDSNCSEDEIIVVGDDPDELPLTDIDLEGTMNSSCNLSRMFRWKFQWSNEEISNLVKMAFPGKDTGSVQDIQIKKRGRSGRVVILSFVTDKGIFEVKGDDIRGILKFKSKYGYYQNLYSTRFNLVKKEENGKIVWTAEGSGWGHGLGMCQFGALGLAKKGATARQILLKYFKGTDIGDYYQLPISKPGN